MEYLERNLFKEIKKWLKRREIIAIKGPRQSGKTTLLKMLWDYLITEENISEESVLTITFEDKEILERFSSDPKNFIKRYTNENKRFYFFIDEAHYCTDIGQKLKLLYDLYENIKFVITGSSSLELTSETAKYLVGRLFSFELLPFSFYEFLNAKDKRLARIYLEYNEKIWDFILNNKGFEIKNKDIFIKELLSNLNEYLVFGGYPEVIKAKNEEEKKIVLKNIFNTYLEKDILAYLQISDIIKFRKFVSMLAFTTSNMVSYEKLTSNCNSYFKEVLHILDILQQTYIINLLRPFHKNLVTELRKNPKVYFYDSGIRNYAVNNFNALDIREDVGKLCENFVFNGLYKQDTTINYWRTTAKAEVDFVLSDIKSVMPIEVKFENIKEPRISRSFHSFLKAYKPNRALIVTKNLWAEKIVDKTKIKFVPIVYF